MSDDIITRRSSSKAPPLLFNIAIAYSFAARIQLYLFSLSGVVLPMVLRRGGARLLRRSRPRHRRLDPLRAEVTARVRDLAGQAIHPGRLQGAIRRGRDSSHRRDRDRAEGKASAALARAGKSRLETDGRSLLSCLPSPQVGESTRSGDNSPNLRTDFAVPIARAIPDKNFFVSRC